MDDAMSRKTTYLGVMLVGLYKIILYKVSIRATEVNFKNLRLNGPRLHIKTLENVHDKSQIQFRRPMNILRIVTLAINARGSSQFAAG